MIDMQVLSNMALEEDRKKKEWEAGAVTRNIERLDKFRTRSAQVHAAFAQKDLAYERLKTDQKEIVEEEEFIKHVRQCRKDDQPLFDRLQTAMDRAKEHDADDLKRFVMKTFNAIFINMRSRTTVVGKCSYGAVTIGTFGFGIRQHVQSARVHGFSDMMSIMKEATDIASGLRDLKLDDWAKKVETFAKIVPDIEQAFDDDISIELNQKLMLPRERYYRDDEPPETCGHVEVKEDYLDVGEFAFSYKNDAAEMEGASLLAYMMLRQHLHQIVQKTEEIVNPAIEKAKKMKEELQQSFGKELLLSEV